jgi:Tol biopolymer transport system component
VFTGATEEGVNLYTVGADGTGREQLTDAQGNEVAPEWSPDAGSIAFAFDDGGSTHWRAGIAVVDPDGSNRTDLVTRDDQVVWGPKWSPDGSRIAFTILEGAQANAPNAYVMDAHGSEVVPLSSRPAVVLSWTPGGDRIVLSSGEDFVTVRPDGTGERILLRDAPEEGRLSMDWSPDGRWATLASLGDSTRGNLYLLRADTGELFLVGSATAPSWRPETA